MLNNENYCPHTPHSIAKKRITSLKILSDTLSISESELIRINSLSDHEKYTELKVPKIDGTDRIVYSLNSDLRKVQYRINKRIFRELIKWPNHLFGSVPSNNDSNKDQIKRDYVACASLHCGAKSILKIDINNFFDNIHKDIVTDIFSNVLKIEGCALELITDLCCKGNFIVQGALTSSYIASLCLHDLEADIIKRAERKNLVYTRLVDDITVSSKLSNFDFSQIKSHIENMLANKDLPVNKNKSKILKESIQPLVVHGLRVDFEQPRIPSDEVKKIRASLHNLCNLAKKNNMRTSSTYRKEYNRCLGRINRLGRLNHNKHSSFIKIIEKIKPLPSWRDVQKTKAALNSLKASYSKGNNNKSWYIRKYHLTYYRTSILNRSTEFHDMVIYLREKLKKIKSKDKRG
ncbi:RNA-directed DNA polymerase [Proteus sp. PR00174]|uniref:reverse transcriptase family protein n=1 Tax=Proteus sp. PR00174 TaxID=2794024 RepID=UPI0018E4A9C7|nr:reverse transcriptase family protein [Proteus sp. PR00174]MBI6512148.1 RNA-directed DNA polymerase [Proteus sp. PR00174]